ncbi:MAG: hypothetical protein H0W76_07985 [Pyrinomonadaceae bacterium]|nr:hypothetical protein [Pyrinomonadaceae bacterium]
MEDHPSLNQLEQYRDRTLPVEKYLAINTHLSLCQHCRQHYDQVAQVSGRFPFSMAPLPIEDAETRSISFWPRMRWSHALGVLAIITGVIFLATVFMWRPASVNHEAQVILPTPSIEPTSLPRDGGPSPPSTMPAATPTTTPFTGRARENNSPRSSDSLPLLALNKRPDVLADLVRPTGVTLKGPNEEAEFTLLSPVGTVVSSDRPPFHWQPVPGATTYRMVATDLDSRKVVISETVTAPQLVPAKPLPRGKILSWGVIASVNGEEVTAPRPPASEARLKILESDQADRLARELKAYAASPVARGVLYARQGLLDDAEREFKAVLTTNSRSASARKFLRMVQSWRSAQSP